MHILVTNDDGPPSNQSSPYVHSLVSALQAAGHTVSVVLPHVQRSWIGKAHIVGKAIKPTYFRPGPLVDPTSTSGALLNTGTTSTRPLPAHAEDEEWILVDSTPASCVQIGLHHYFQSRGPVDLVVSGPNYGRNTTAVFALSSGTIGGAMEAAMCGVKSIALSYAFFDRNHDPTIITGASTVGVKVIEHLYHNWDQDVDLYSVNVPLVENVGEKKVMWTKMLQNRWKSGSCFQEVDVPEQEDQNADEAEMEIRDREGREGESKAPARTETPGGPHPRYVHKHFKWAPQFTDVYQSVEAAGPGEEGAMNDGWAVKESMTSVTPLKANFMHAPNPRFQGEIKL